MLNKPCKAIVLITEKTYCFQDYIYIMSTFLLWDLSTLCVVDHIWPLILCSLLGLLSSLWFTGTSNVYMYNVCQSIWVATEPLWWYPEGYIVFMITLCPTCFYEIWALWVLCVSWITYDHIYTYTYKHDSQIVHHNL